jgi:glucose-1-phosphate adenylyltransferase
MLISDLKHTLAMVLAVGNGTALEPLTTRRSIAAIPFGGNYRVIDFTLTNCLHSGLRRIGVLTQFNSLSLQRHLRDGWSIFNTDLGEFVMPVPPPVRGEPLLYSSSANALYQNLYLLDGVAEDNVIIISGEQIYRMDYAALLEFHAERNADATVVGIDPSDSNGAVFRTMLAAEGDDIADIAPRDRIDAGGSARVLGPMGVYVFARPVLVDVLNECGEAGTSGRNIPELIGERLLGTRRLLMYPFGGAYGRVSPDRYWRPLDNLDSYYDANMDLLRLEPPLDLYQSDWSIRTYQMQGPPARTVPGRSCNEGICVNSIVSGGTVIAGGGVSRSVLGNRVYIDDGAAVEDSILFSGVKVGEGARITRCICDRNVVIPAGEEIGTDRGEDAKRFRVTDNGVVVIPSNYEFY